MSQPSAAQPNPEWAGRCMECHREAVVKCLECAELACLAHYAQHAAFAPDGKCPHERGEDDE